MIPLVYRVSSQPNFIKPSPRFSFHSFSNGVNLKPLDRVKASSGFHLHNMQIVSVVRKRNFSNGFSQKESEGGGEGRGRGRKTLPWIAGAYRNKEKKSFNKGSVGKGSHSSWEESANKFVSKPVEDVGTSRNQLAEMVENYRGDENAVAENVDEEVVDDPRWDRIKSRYRRISDREVGSDRPEVRRWSKEENWGRKTWKEASESTLPKMTGEGIYGVGPVLAALSSGRRDFYTLYVQEGLDLSSNNRKKKDKKGFERILRIADKIGLTRKEVSKHDLNMIVDNRPHQGLVLDASPLDLVSIRELDPVLVEGEAAPLWVALDEVTDPQNLGAIIRSSCFFGAAGVVLCAKNSAPLSGVVSKASAGSLELMELRSCKNMMQFLCLSAENGWRVLGGSVSSRALSLNDVASGVPTILVLGSEGKGLRPLVERSCTNLVRIPGNIPIDISPIGGEEEKAGEMDYCSGEEFRSFMAVESLNVSVAAGVLLHHLIGNNHSYSVDDKLASVPLESLSSE